MVFIFIYLQLKKNNFGRHLRKLKRQHSTTLKNNPVKQNNSRKHNKLIQKQTQKSSHYKTIENSTYGDTIVAAPTKS